MEDSDKVDSSTPTSGGSDSEEAALDDSTGGTEEDGWLLAWLEIDVTLLEEAAF